MKRWFLHILFVGVLGMLTASCSQILDDPTQTMDCHKAQVVFTIALDSPSAASRGTWGDNYDDNTTNNYGSDIGDAFDNRINPDKFFVKLTLGEKTYDVQNIVHWQTAEQNVYEFVGEVDVNINQTTPYTNAKIMVYANMDPTNGSFDNATFNRDAAYIPMFGVQKVSLSLTPGTRTTLSEPIYLLRAMAKVEINMEAEGYTLTNVSLNRYNSTGYCLPDGAGSVEDTKFLHYDDGTLNSFRPTNSSGTNLNFSVSNNHLTFYLPEVANGTGDNELKMTLTLKRGTESVTLQAPYLYFRQYTNGKAEGANPFDVVRNHWYQYNITAVNTSVDVSLGIYYQVIDWTTVTNPNLTFGNDYGNVLEGESESSDSSINNGTETESGNASGN